MKSKFCKLYILGAVICVGGLLASCEKEADQWLQDNFEVIGNIPAIASFNTTPAVTEVVAGTTVKLDLRYWSKDPIDKINLNAKVGSEVKQTVSSTAYQAAYSKVSKTDSLILEYAVPAGLAKGVAIELEAEIINKTALKNASKLTVKIK
jgi:hypothetical protein